VSSIFSATNEGEEALAAATAETVIALIGSTAVKGKLVEFGISFDGISATAEPVIVRMVRTTADDGTSSAATEVQFSDPDNPTPNCAAKHSYSVEPTKASQAMATWHVHPQAGFIIQWPLGREPGLDNTTSNGIAFEVTAPAIVNCITYIAWEE
jgi:hypothetical protein